MFGMEVLDECLVCVRIGAGLTDDLLAALSLKLGTPRLVDASTIGPNALTDGTAFEMFQTAVVQIEFPYRLFIFAELSFDHRFVLRAPWRGGYQAICVGPAQDTVLTEV
jgi:hypothetical protein